MAIAGEARVSIGSQFCTLCFFGNDWKALFHQQETLNSQPGKSPLDKEVTGEN
jgi:hypothetical protein